MTWLVVALFTKTPLRIYALPSTTAPFCIVATGILLSTQALHVSAAPSATIDSAAIAFVRSLLTNVSEVVLINNEWSGALILLGLFVASWKVGLAGLLGSVVGSLCALAIGRAAHRDGQRPGRLLRRAHRHRTGRRVPAQQHRCPGCLRSLEPW